MKKLTKKPLAVAIIAVAVAVLGGVVPVGNTYAAGIQNGINAAQGTGVATNLFGTSGTITTIVNVLLFVIGVISVIMLIVGGIRYAVSAGDSNAVTGAKNTITYAVVGLVIAFLAYAIVNWVLAALLGNAATS